MDGLILKLDSGKAYDKVNWSFLQQVLRMKGFSERWCAWVDKIVTGESVSVKVNDDMGHFSKLKKVCDKETLFLLYSSIWWQIYWLS